MPTAQPLPGVGGESLEGKEHCAELPQVLEVSSPMPASTSSWEIPGDPSAEKPPQLSYWSAAMMASLPSTGELSEDKATLGSGPLGSSSDVSSMEWPPHVAETPSQEEAAFTFVVADLQDISEGSAHGNGLPGAHEPDEPSPSEGEMVEEGSQEAASVSPCSGFTGEASKKGPSACRPLTARSWEFPMAAQEKWHRLILVYEKEAAMAEAQATRHEANEQRLAELALTLKAENSRLRVQRRKLRAKLLRAKHLCAGQRYRGLGRCRRKGASSCSAAETSSGCEDAVLSQMRHQLQQHRRWLDKARSAKEVLVAREAAAVAERAWVRDQLTALWQENAGLRCRLEKNMASTAKVATPGRSKASLCCCAC